MSAQLRPYAPGDFNALYQIDGQCFKRGVAYTRRDLKQYLHLPGANCIVAEVDAQIAGFCLTAHEDSYGYIVTMDVLPPFRRQGLATVLLRRAEKDLRKHGVRAVSLETATNNDSAVLFWQRHGYRTRGIRKNYYPGKIDAYSMTKILAGRSSF